MVDLVAFLVKRVLPDFIGILLLTTAVYLLSFLMVDRLMAGYIALIVACFACFVRINDHFGGS